MSVRILEGDALQVLRTLPDQSVQCCITSPPYFGLRDYGVTGQLGLEKTPQLYVDAMVGVFSEVKRVLRDDGTLWLNIGDSYAGYWGDKKALAEGRPSAADGQGFSMNSRPKFHDAFDGSSVKPKDLIGIPWMLAFALRADGWYLRSDIIWHKPNVMPESVMDRPTKAHEYLFLLTKSERYLYDANAIREPASTPLGSRKALRTKRNGESAVDTKLRGSGTQCGTPSEMRNRRSVWTVSTTPYREAHFATFPSALIEPCILAASAAQACEKCGAPWERVLSDRGVRDVERRSSRLATGVESRKVGGEYQRWLDENPKTTLGFKPTCDCENQGTGRSLVLDPFGGAGTTGLVADRLGRDALLIELNPKYAEMARKRIYSDNPLFGDVA